MTPRRQAERVALREQIFGNGSWEVAFNRARVVSLCCDLLCVEDFRRLGLIVEYRSVIYFEGRNVYVCELSDAREWREVGVCKR